MKILGKKRTWEKMWGDTKGKEGMTWKEGGGGRGGRWEREEVGEGGGGRGRRWEREEEGEGGGGRGRRWEREEVGEEGGGKGRRWEREEVGEGGGGTGGINRDGGQRGGRNTAVITTSNRHKSHLVDCHGQLRVYQLEEEASDVLHLVPTGHVYTLGPKGGREL